MAEKIKKSKTYLIFGLLCLIYLSKSVYGIQIDIYTDTNALLMKNHTIIVSVINEEKKLCSGELYLKESYFDNNKKIERKFFIKQISIYKTTNFTIYHRFTHTGPIKLLAYLKCTMDTANIRRFSTEIVNVSYKQLEIAAGLSYSMGNAYIPSRNSLFSFYYSEIIKDSYGNIVKNYCPIKQIYINGKPHELTDGKFEKIIPAGKYTIKYGNITKKINISPGSSYIIKQEKLSTRGIIKGRAIEVIRNKKKIIWKKILKNKILKLYRGDEFIKDIKTDENGYFIVEAEAGSYTLRIE